MIAITVSVPEFKPLCLDMIRQVVRVGVTFELTRRGKIVARLLPTSTMQKITQLLSLRGAGTLHAQPGKSVLDAADFDAG